MTIGIAVHGAGAGLAVFRALEGVEKVGRGAIGGFASFVCLTAAGELLRAETQRGGTRTLFTDGERTGVLPPETIARAPFAAVMSSGPDRPSPLAQFTPGAVDAGLVSGHRLPNVPGVDGLAVNVAVLDRMRAGAPAREAVEAELRRNPMADAGVIALDLRGGLFAMNSEAVARREDLGQAFEVDEETGAQVAVLHNAIHPVGPLAGLAASLALDAMNPLDRIDFRIEVRAGTPVVIGSDNALVLDDAGALRHIEVTNPDFLRGCVQGAVIGPRAVVRQGAAVLGRATSEPYGVVRDGVVETLSGGAAASIGVRAMRQR